MKRQKKAMLIAEEEILLSKERTILSFMRTALAFIGVGVVIIRFMNETVFQVIGYGLVILGFAEVLESYRRLREKQKIMKRIEKQIKL